MAPEGAAGIRGWAVSAGIVVACVLAVVALGGAHLDAQGAYHDEIYQAPAAFAWAGQPAGPFSLYRVGGLPLFTMPYSGALKPAIFGLYMRATGDYWSLPKWRLYSLLLYGFGVGVLAATAQRRVGGLAAAVVGLLCVTDMKHVVSARHDGASAAMGFLLRASLLSVWLACGRRPLLAAAAIGGFAGLAAYDKLHALALVPAVAVLLLAMGGGAGWRGYLRRAAAATAGFALGAVPVIWVHVHTWFARGAIWSLAGRRISIGPRTPSANAYLWDFATMGIPNSVHDIALPSAQVLAEGIAFVVVLLAVTLYAARYRLPRPAALVGAWVAIVVALAVMPARTRGLHWMVATPVVYAALAVALRREPGDAGPGRRRGRLALVALACGWLVTRGFPVTTTQGILQAGVWSIGLQPNYTRFARHAARHHPDAPFVVTRWGIANSLFCEGQGRPGWVLDVGGLPPGTVVGQMTRTRHRHFFLVGFETRRPGEVNHAERYLAALRADPHWVESADLGGLGAFPPVAVWRFDRVLDRPSTRP